MNILLLYLLFTIIGTISLCSLLWMGKDEFAYLYKYGRGITKAIKAGKKNYKFEEDDEFEKEYNIKKIRIIAASLFVNCIPIVNIAFSVFGFTLLIGSIFNWILESDY